MKNLHHILKSTKFANKIIKQRRYETNEIHPRAPADAPHRGADDQLRRRAGDSHDALGTWEGQLSTEFYQDRWGGYGQTYYTVWHFEGKPGSRHGKGWEIDYVGHQRYAQHFDWQVIDDGRTVRLHYAGAWDDEWIYNFYLDDSYFTGYIDSGDGKQSFFQLERVEDNGYDHDYGWDFRAQRPLQTKGTAEKGK